MKVKIKHLFAGFAILSSLLIFGCTQLQDSLSSSNDDETTTSSTSTSSGEGKTVTIYPKEQTKNLSSSGEQIVSSVDMIENITEIEITLANATSTTTTDWWVTAYTGSWENQVKVNESWSDSLNGYDAKITDSVIISAWTKNGIYIGGNVSGILTITITYTE